MAKNIIIDNTTLTIFVLLQWSRNNRMFFLYQYLIANYHVVIVLLYRIGIGGATAPSII